MTGGTTYAAFRTAFLARFEAARVAFDPLLLCFMDGLGAAGHVHIGGETVVTIEDPTRPEGLTSDVYFCQPPDLVRHWFGEGGYEDRIIPFLHASSTGSYIALWQVEGQPQCYVFLGDEGECLTLAESASDLIRLLANGYIEIYGRDSLAETPEEQFEDSFDEEFMPPSLARSLCLELTGEAPPETYTTHLPYVPGEDPFEAFVTKAIGG
ncbi:hypothetical protein HCZ23_03810 [Celeribacter sp. HF31]|uniref:hypothetical protein n=1 Tax=Celeribacter sp. HF31 TaxID=2721558 RepID=UPI00142FB4CC|nr:hypothetical protein [Celeribacter sp. HF31]NIY78595.1 hypothetical protein [Celeribacter sp. HF31]